VAVDQEIQDLQAVSQHVLTAADKIKKLELEKRSVPPGSPRFIDLSAEIERLAADLGVVSASETDIALEVAGEPDLPTIEQADHKGSVE
jgi:hypothetical protein